MDTTGKKTIYAVKPAFLGIHKIVADADGHHQPSPTYGEFSGCVLLQYMWSASSWSETASIKDLVWRGQGTGRERIRHHIHQQTITLLYSNLQGQNKGNLTSLFKCCSTWNCKLTLCILGWSIPPWKLGSMSFYHQYLGTNLGVHKYN